MYQGLLTLGSFNGSVDVAQTDGAVDILCDAYTRIDMMELRGNPHIPLIYDLANAGKLVYYRPKPLVLTDTEVIEEPDNWRDALTTFHQGWGDCKDLVCWRVAELRLRFKVPAKHKTLRWFGPNGYRFSHIVVEWPNGVQEDISRNLGME